jgi:hypothetical protein
MSKLANFQAEVDRRYQQVLRWIREGVTSLPDSDESFVRVLKEEIHPDYHWKYLGPLWGDGVELGLVTAAEFPSEPRDVWAAIKLLEVLRNRCRGKADDDGYPEDKTEDAPVYVTLAQMAAMVNRSKRTLENLKDRKKNPLPDPDVTGGGGKADEWLWDHIRPWLETEYGRSLSKFNPPQYKLR